MTCCSDLELPGEAFVSLDMPVMNTPVVIGEERHLLWLCRVMWVALHAMAESVAVTPEQLLVQVQTQDQLDQLCIAYAQRYLLNAWPRIEELVAGLSEPSLPLRYKQRDRHIPALKLYMARQRLPSKDTDAVFNGLVALADYDPDHYRTLVALLEQGDGLTMARAALSAFDGKEGTV